MADKEKPSFWRNKLNEATLLTAGGLASLTGGNAEASPKSSPQPISATSKLDAILENQPKASFKETLDEDPLAHYSERDRAALDALSAGPKQGKPEAHVDFASEHSQNAHTEKTGEEFVQQKEKSHNARLFTINPPVLPPKGEFETDTAYAKRTYPQSLAYTNANLRYLVALQTALEKGPGYPIVEEITPTWRRCIKPAGNDMSVGVHPPIITLSPKAADNTVKGLHYADRLLLEITINKDGEEPQAYAGLEGCHYCYQKVGEALTAFEEFPAGADAQQAVKMIPDPKKGDRVFINIPRERLVESAKQLGIIMDQLEAQRQNQR